jgi:AraC-like DNA-binding protein
MLKSTRNKHEFVHQWVDQGEKIRTLLDSDGPETVERLIMMGHSLRGIARKTGLSSTYLSQVKNEQSRISPTAYLTLLRLEMKGKPVCRATN